MTPSYLAHISANGQAQSVLEHLRGTASLAEDFARPFGAEKQARLVGLAHDIGKYSDAFQKRLHGAPIQVDHSTAGAVECWQRRKLFAAFAVAGHHGGLPDGGSQTDSPDQATLWGRVKRAGRLEPYGRWAQEVSLPQADIPDFLKRPGPEWVFFTRMLYSCLVDADFLDTEAFMDGRSRAHNATSIEQLWEMLQGYISSWFPPKGELNPRSPSSPSFSPVPSGLAPQWIAVFRVFSSSCLVRPIPFSLVTFYLPEYLPTNRKAYVELPVTNFPYMFPVLFFECSNRHLENSVRLSIGRVGHTTQ